MGAIKFHGVYADHGELAPDALGVVLELDGVMVYHTGDTAYRPVQFQPAIEMKPDILLPCINGAYGNMDWREAAQLTQLVCAARCDSDALLDVCGAERRSRTISPTLCPTRPGRASDVDEAG